jgi:hypothetical protein
VFQEDAMTPALGRSDLLFRLTSTLRSLGLTVTTTGPDGLAGAVESIRAKWFLGGRKVAYTMSCHLVEAERCARLREMTAERSWGIPPPTLTVETTTVRGWQRSGTRTDHSVGGGGTLDYAQVRNAVEAVVTEAGWQLRLDGGRMP